MKTKQYPIELLAPAKDIECAKAAILCGADAVYIGGPNFGARVNASNSLNAIESLIRFAHFYRAKVYVTLNTLLYEQELQNAATVIKGCYEMGADAMIIQDMGLLGMDLPPIPLFASTQTHNATPEKVLFLEKTGFQRVILARELSLQEIREIREKTTLELESFIHGALCVSYSGQCYLSYAYGKRSGNRGECAQPCRNIYSLKTGSGKNLMSHKHLLSLKDLNLSDSIKEMIEAGINSFKIEGRLKDIAYIKNVVSFYRLKLDEVLEEKKLIRASVGKSFIDFSPDPLKTFHRGSCDYFLNGRKPGITSWDTPKFKGEPIGEVLSVSGESFSLPEKSLIHNLVPGDGICYLNPDGVLTGTLIYKVQADKIYPDSMEGINSKTMIYRNYNHLFLQKIKTAKTERKIGLDLIFFETSDGFSLKAVDEEGNEETINKPYEKVAAKKPEKSLETIEKQLSKLGDFFYYLRKRVDIHSKPYFFPVSFLNELRRETLDGLNKKRQKNYRPIKFQIVANSFPYPEKRLTYEGNILNSKSIEFYKRHGVEEIEKAPESGLEMSGKQVMTTRYCILYEMGRCKKKQGAPQEDYFLEDSKGKKLRLEFDCKNCRMRVFF